MITVDPADNATNVPTAAHVVVIGSLPPGSTFDYAALTVSVGGYSAIAAGAAVRPAFSAVLTKTPTRFRLEIRPRRPFLYRVKQLVTASIDVKTGPSTTSDTVTVSFTTVDATESPEVSRLRSALNQPFRLAELPALSLVHHHTRAVLGGDAFSDGGFWLRAARCARRSELWSVVHVADLIDGTLEGAGRILDALRGPDAAHPDPARALSLIEMAWEPAMRELGHVGVSAGVTDLLRRAFNADHAWERFSAACAALLIAQAAGSRIEAGAITEARGQGYL